MLELIAPQRAHLQVALHREHLRHRVGNRRAGREDHATAFVLRLDVLNLEEHIECALGSGLRQTGNARHLRDVEEILELVRLVDEEPVDAKFLEGQRVVLLVVGGKRFELRRQPLLHPLQFLHQPCASLALLLPDRSFDFVKLLVDEGAACLHRYRDFLEARMGDDDAIPIPRRDAAEKPRSLRRLEVLLAGNQNVRRRVQREQLRRKLREHVIRNNEHRLRRQPKPLQLNPRRDHRVGLSRADRVREERVVALHDPPNRVLLVRPKDDLLAARGQCEMAAVEHA